MSKSFRLVQITFEHQDCPFLTVFLTIKTSSQNISITLLQISLKFHEHQGSYDVIATLIITNFHLYLIQLWCQFFQIFAYGDVVYAQTWEVLILKNYIDPP